MSTPDAGQPLTDAGQPLTDAGQPLTDAGQPVTDAGQPGTDAGASDAGPFDAGPPTSQLPDPPTHVTASYVGYGEIEVSWTAPANSGSDPIISYSVISTPGMVGETTSSTSALLLSGFLADVAYTFTVHATTLAGDSVESEPSNVVIIAGTASFDTSTFVAQPESVPADGVSISTLTLTLKDVAGIPLSGQPVYVTVSGSGNILTGEDTLTDNAGVWTGTLASTVAETKYIGAQAAGLEFNTMATFGAAGLDAGVVDAGSSIDAGATDAGAGEMDAGAPPGAPSNIVASLDQRSQEVSVSWDVPVDSGDSAISGYTVTSTPDGLTITSTQTSALYLGGLRPDVNYTFTVHATNAGGNSPESMPSNTVMLLGPPTASTSSLVATPPSVRADGSTSINVTLTVEDPLGYPLPGLPVAMMVSGNGNNLSDPADSTDANGRMTTQVTSTVAGQKTLTAYVSGRALLTVPVQFLPPPCTPKFVQQSPLLSAGSYPVAIVNADFNGDHVPDLALSAQGTSEFDVILGKGHGSFGGTAAYPEGSSQSYAGLAVGDMNGDGTLDLATVATFESFVATLFGEGNGMFGNVGPGEPTIDNAANVAIGDFNRDGFADLAVSDSRDSRVYIVTVQNREAFNHPVYYSVGYAPNGVTTADFNGDHILDLVVVNVGGHSVTPFIGVGDGSFSVKPTIPLGQGPQTAVAADLNGDGYDDLVIDDPASVGFYVLISKGDGTFQPVIAITTATYPMYASLSGLVVGDFNGDGKPDVAGVSSVNKEALLYLGDGTGGFAAPAIFPLTVAPNAVTVADFDGDGYLDLATANGTTSTNSSVALLLNQCQ